MGTMPSQTLDSFPNPKPERDYLIRCETPEFTCLCPKTGQPDFATVRVEYVPDQLCVELKSWKLYLWSYRNQGAFHEAVINRILDDWWRRFIRGVPASRVTSTSVVAFTPPWLLSISRRSTSGSLIARANPRPNSPSSCFG